MPRSQTIEVLNDAYDMQRRLDWVLFSNENENYGSETDWVPGDPIYDHPWRAGGGQYVRPMFELMEEFHNIDRVFFFARCKDCMVSWEGAEPCWVCGEDRPHPLGMVFGMPTSYDFVSYSEADVEATRRLYSRPQLRVDIDVEPFVEGANFLRDLLAELSHQLETSVTRAFEGFTRVVISTPRQSGHRPWGVILDEWEEAYNSTTVNVNGITIPRYIPTEPEIPMPDFQFNSTDFQEIAPKSYPTSINPTRQRRPRRS